MLSHDEGKHTQHARIDDRSAIEETNDNKRQAKRHGELAAIVADEDLVRAEGKLNLGEALPEGKDGNDGETDAKTHEDLGVGSGQVGGVDDGDEDEDGTDGEEGAADPVEALEGGLEGNASGVLGGDCSSLSV